MFCCYDLNYPRHTQLLQIPIAALNGDASGLMVLSLRGNPVRSVPSGAFARLSSLVRLDLSGCGLETLAAGAFDGLTAALQRLMLHSNRLTTMPSNMPPALHEITLHDNRQGSCGNNDFPDLIVNGIKHNCGNKLK
jgi:Leucine-rich repeat (LRR) protein